MSKAVFLDRDGVINRALIRNGKPFSPRSLSEFEFLPGVIAAGKKLAAADFKLFVVTNQPDIGNNLVSADVVEYMHNLIREAMPVSKIYICPHRQDEECECRKPKPGMLLTAQKEFAIDMAASFMIGDRYSDICAARAAGCGPIFIDNNYIETPDFDDTIRAQDLAQATHHILESLTR